MANNKKARHVKNLGSVYYDSTTSQYVGQMENGRYANGRVKFKRFYSTSQEECIYKMKQFKEDIANAATNESSTIDDKQPLFSEYLKFYLFTIKKPKLKIASYDREIRTAENNIIPHIGGYKLSELNTKLIQDKLINKLVSKNYSYSTINKVFVLTNECLRFACHQDLIPKNPCEFVIKPTRSNVKVEEKNIRFFTDDEISRFIDVALSKYDNGKSRYTNGYPLIILIYTGLRIGEMLALKWKDVDLKNRFIRVKANIAVVKQNDVRKVVLQNSTKTRDSRVVHLTTSALKYFEEYNRIVSPNQNDFVFVTEGLRDVSAIRNSYLGICKRANIDDPQGLHTLRHTFASLMIRKGVDIKIISEMLGHSSVSFTYNTYVHLLEEEKAKVIAQIDI